MAIVIGVCGATASGKSTLTDALRERLSEHSPVVLRQDHYFRSWMNLPEGEREAIRTSNHPRAVLWEPLVAHVRALREGGAVRLPVAGTRGQERGERPFTQGPTDLLVVEGHLLYNREDLCGLIDLRLFVDTHPHERVVRRLLRDTARGTTKLSAAAAWYRRDVLPNVGPYSEALRGRAHLIVPFDRENEAALAAVTTWSREKLKWHRIRVTHV